MIHGVCAVLLSQSNLLIFAWQVRSSAMHLVFSVLVVYHAAQLTSLMHWRLPQGDDRSQNLALRLLMNVLICAISTMHIPSSS